MSRELDHCIMLTRRLGWREPAFRSSADRERSGRRDACTSRDAPITPCHSRPSQCTCFCARPAAKAGQGNVEYPSGKHTEPACTLATLLVLGGATS